MSTEKGLPEGSEETLKDSGNQKAEERVPEGSGRGRKEHEVDHRVLKGTPDATWPPWEWSSVQVTWSSWGPPTRRWDVRLRLNDTHAPFHSPPPIVSESGAMDEIKGETLEKFSEKGRMTDTPPQTLQWTGHEEIAAQDWPQRGRDR